MTASVNSFEDKFLGRISHRLSTTRVAGATLDIGFSGRSPTVWRREDQIAVEVEAKQPAPISTPKSRIRPVESAPVIVAKTVVIKPDPAIAIEAARKAAEQRRVAAAKVETLRLENERAESRRIAAATEAAAQAARDEENRRWDEAQRKADEADRLAWLQSHAAPLPKPKAATPKVEEAPSTRRKPGQGVSLEQIRAMAAAPIRTVPRPSMAEIEKTAGTPGTGSGKRSKWPAYKPNTRKSMPYFTPSTIPEFGPVPTDRVELNKRIEALDSGIVVNVYRGAVIKFRWQTTKEMSNAKDDADTNAGLRSFVERCEKATVKAARKGKK